MLLQNWGRGQWNRRGVGVLMGMRDGLSELRGAVGRLRGFCQILRETLGRVFCRERPELHAREAPTRGSAGRRGEGARQRVER